MAITLKQIAKLAGVSCSTVSRVINNQPGVRPQTRERVLIIVREYGYEPDSVARSLAFKRLRKAT
jgi:LacI family transcriptional regulator